MIVSTKTFDVVKVKKAKKRYEFLSDDKIVGQLDFPKRYSKAALASAGDNKWQIRRTGWWKTYLEIESQQSPYTKWKVNQNWKGGLSIRTDDNKTYSLCRKGFWRTSWVWTNEKNEPVIEMRHCSWPSKKTSSITFAKIPDQHLVLLALAGWFVLICAQDEAAAAAAAA